MRKKPRDKDETERLPLDDAAEDPQAIEDSLEREAPTEKRTRYSPEYGNAPTADTTPEETRFKPDGSEVYPEPEAEFRARGGNIEGSMETQKRETENPEPAVEGPNVSTQIRNAESDAQGGELEGHEE